MADGLLSTVMLICAVLASLAIGVLIAHGICVAMFATFRNHARQVAAARTPQTAAVVAPAAASTQLEAMRG
jgi:hypothetical protein